MINALISEHSIKSNSLDALTLQQKSNIGEKKDNYVEYSSTEALFLLNSKKLIVIQNGKKLSHEEALKKIKKHDKNVEKRAIVYADLHKKGYIVKDGLKFGGDFRVYKLKEAHARWIVSIVSEKQKIDWRDFAAKNRVANSTNKKMLFALIDNENDISYYEVAWIRP